MQKNNRELIANCEGEKVKDCTEELIISRVAELMENKQRIIIAIDGRCGAGKTTFAKRLQKELGANLFHMDDFFLRPKQRTSERLQMPGENVDHERFLKEVLEPLIEGESFSYQPYDCSTGQLMEPVNVEPKKVSIIEGSYACHNSLWNYYDLHIFMDIDFNTQIERIKRRNGEKMADRFKNVWIPLEEEYFTAFDIKERCEICVK